MSDYIASVTCVASFKRDVDVRHRAKQLEEAFGRFVGEKVQAASSNLPDQAPASLPRLLMQGQNKQLILSQLAMQLELTFDSNPEGALRQFDNIFGQLQEYLKSFSTFKSDAQREDTGVTLMINFPSTLTTEELGRELYEKAFRLPLVGDIASAQAQLGFRTSSGYYKNFAIAGYVIQKVERDTDPVEQIRSVAAASVKNRGQSVSIDVNNRPMMQGLFPRKIDDGELLALLRSAFLEDLPQLWRSPA